MGDDIALNARLSTSNADGEDHASRLAPRSSRSGYVELPYTLVQDSTLFLVLREPTPEIWLRKLDWVVQHGGMALVNVHPDYLRFPGEPASARTFPAEFYKQFLEYACQKYGSSFWHRLPKEVAGWYGRKILREPDGVGQSDALIVSKSQKHPGSCALRGKHAAVVLYARIASDARPRRELDALLDEGMSVDLICLAGKCQRGEKGGSWFASRDQDSHST